MSPHHCVALAALYVPALLVTLLTCLPVTLGWRRHDVSSAIGLARQGPPPVAPDVPDVLLGCHAPIHGLGQGTELTYYLFQELHMHIGTIDTMFTKLAFIDNEEDVLLPRKLSGYRKNEKLVQYKTADDHLTYPSCRTSGSSTLPILDRFLLRTLHSDCHSTTSRPSYSSIVIRTSFGISRHIGWMGLASRRCVRPCRDDGRSPPHSGKIFGPSSRRAA
ncbi:unnamed protein product [Vitrella brassicaformis CCMP3155]|uniref:Uncharacterized protein n=1 Tax=Vitrella brassicaformis (strain CCMP3155) TaxID=1169540 RepID=A0A0G4G0R7_VITBC|nr:unnamed protein product [Vitrella brassicaformis CCMP3155]|eukprot:CEM21135.1 unnamed protein product [Vitrella brassicaformis CCMP3155]